MADDETPLRSAPAMLLELPKPLRLLHGPIPVTVETWADGSVVARWPEAALYGEGESEVAALWDLAETLHDAVSLVVADRAGGGDLADALGERWRALTALVGVGDLT